MGGDNIEVGVRVENQGSRLTLGSRLMLVRSVITSSGRATGCLLPWERATPCPVSDGEVHAPSRPRKQLRGATDPPPLTPNRGQEGCVAPWQALQGTSADQCGRPIGSRTELQTLQPVTLECGDINCKPGLLLGRQLHRQQDCCVPFTADRPQPRIPKKTSSLAAIVKSKPSSSFFTFFIFFSPSPAISLPFWERCTLELSSPPVIHDAKVNNGPCPSSPAPGQPRHPARQSRRSSILRAPDSPATTILGLCLQPGTHCQQHLARLR